MPVPRMGHFKPHPHDGRGGDGARKLKVTDLRVLHAPPRVWPRAEDKSGRKGYELLPTQLFCISAKECALLMLQGRPCSKLIRASAGDIHPA